MEGLNIRRGFGLLLNDRYKTPNTSLMEFHFEPAHIDEQRLKKVQIKKVDVDGKHIYLFDHYLTDAEEKELVEYSKNATFSRTSYANQEAKEKGEEPARSMTNKEKWDCFINPPKPIKEMYLFLGHMAEALDADIYTLPWDLCDEHICASAVATNRVEQVSHESQEMGQHHDYEPEEGIPFAIPILYGRPGEHFGKVFANGAPGNPWMVSLMLYAAPDSFLPEYGMGTAFFDKKEALAFRADCKNGRFVLFEGDILHSIEESKIPKDVKLWRVSYVYKLVINPKKSGQSVKEDFMNATLKGAK